MPAILRRNRRLLTLFVLMVVLPTLVFGWSTSEANGNGRSRGWWKPP